MRSLIVLLTALFNIAVFSGAPALAEETVVVPPAAVPAPALAPSPTSTPEIDALPLKKRASVLQYKNGKLLELEKEIDAAAGFHIDVEVDWPSLARDTENPADYEEYWSKVYFLPLIEALKNGPKDAASVEILKGKLKKVIARSAPQMMSANNFTLSNGELVLLHQSDTNVSYGYERTEGIEALLY